MIGDRYKCDCGCLGVGPALTDILRHIGPEEARKHFRAARVEFLKGVRSLIDARINHLSRSESSGTTVPVE